jgi:hypothetical protein
VAIHPGKSSLLLDEAVSRRLHPVAQGWTAHSNKAIAGGQHCNRAQDEENAVHAWFTVSHRRAADLAVGPQPLSLRERLPL